MRILQINATYHNSGSTDRIEHDINAVLLRNGFESYIAYGYDGVIDDDSRVVGFQSKYQRKLNIVKCRIWPRHGFYNIPETTNLIKWIQKIKPDVIHLHNIHNHYVNVKLLFDYIKEYNMPVVWTLHDCWSFTGWCTYFDYAKCEKWKNGCYDCPNKHDYPYTWFFDLSKSNYEKKKECFTGVNKLRLVTPSKWLADLTRDSYLKEYPVDVIYNGIDISKFKPCGDTVKSKLSIDNKKMILAVASGFSKRKGIDYLLKLPDMLSEDEVLVMLGLTPEQKKLIPRRSNCIGLGRVGDVNELAHFYSSADVFINPTLEDNFPTTNIEAMACGTPVVTFRTGGSIEPITESTGMVVEKGDLKGLYMGIKKVIENPLVFESSKCVEWANMNCNKETQFGKYLELYKSLV